MVLGCSRPGEHGSPCFGTPARFGPAVADVGQTPDSSCGPDQQIRRPACVDWGLRNSTRDGTLSTVAEIYRPSDYGSEGWGFESLRARNIIRYLTCGNAGYFPFKVRPLWTCGAPTVLVSFGRFPSGPSSPSPARRHSIRILQVVVTDGNRHHGRCLSMNSGGRGAISCRRSRSWCSSASGGALSRAGRDSCGDDVAPQVRRAFTRDHRLGSAASTITPPRSTRCPSRAQHHQALSPERRFSNRCAAGPRRSDGRSIRPDSSRAIRTVSAATVS